jgi:WD40 repeat protein
VSGSGDSTVRIWDAISGKLQRSLEGHTDWVRSVAFSFDGLRILSGSDDCIIHVWDAVSGVLLHILEGHTQGVRSVAFSSDGSRIVSGSTDGTMRIWDSYTRTVQHIIEGYDLRNDLRSFLVESPLCNGMSTSSKWSSCC